MQKFKLMLVVALLCFTQLAFSQKSTLVGKISIKSDNSSLPGTNIYLMGTTLGTVSNNKGKYQIKNITPGNYKLVVSFSGYKRIIKQITLKKGITSMNFKLVPTVRALGQVVVTGTGTAHHLKSAPILTELINKKDIEAVSSSDFSDMLTRISPSIDITPGAMGSFLTLNGLSNDFIVILIDGKRAYGDIGGNIDLNRINIGEIDHIEIVKGASSLLYGSDAISGVINIITKHSHRKFNMSNYSRYSKYGTFNQNNNLALNFGRLSSISNIGFKQSNGWQLTPYDIKVSKKTKKEELIKTDAMSQNAYRTNTYSQKLNYNITKKLSIYANGSYYLNDYIYPLTVKKYSFYHKNISYNLGAKFLLHNKDYISVDYNNGNYKYYHKYNQEYKNYTLGQKSLQYNQNMNNLRVKYINSFSKSNKLTLGVDYLKEKLESQDRLDSDNDKAKIYTLATYAQDEIKIIKNLDIVAGIRYIHNEEFGNSFTPKISALYKLNKFNFRATYGIGFKAPTLKELHYKYSRRGTMYLGNIDLDPQKSKYSSFGIEYHNKRSNISVTAYRNDVNDLINYKILPLNDEDIANNIKHKKQQINIDKTRSQGIDIIFDTKLVSGFTLGGAYSYVDARNRKTRNVLDRVAFNYATLNLGYSHSWKEYKLRANFSGRIQSKKHYINADNGKEYNLWKLTTNHEFTNKLGINFILTAGIDNIFDYVDDAPYSKHRGTFNPGRTFFVGINFNISR